MFEDEADTISVDVGFDTSPVGVDAFDTTKPIEVKQTSDTCPDTSPLEMVDVFDDTDAVIISTRLASMSDDTTHVRLPRPSTNADWPPEPKGPASRRLRRAGMFQAITSITKETALES